MSPPMLRMLCFTFFLAILSIQQCICAYSPENSPSPAPVSGGDLGSLPPIAAAPKTPSPSPSPSPLANVSSPPASPPTDHSTNSAPAPSPVSGDNTTPTPASAPVAEPPSPSPSPAPSDVAASDISHESNTAEVDESSSSDGGMNGGKKAGVAFGVVAAACVVGLGALVYKKRRQNIRRAQFGHIPLTFRPSSQRSSSLHA
ncbi:hypothetical protein AABB24_018998 [Solanum stoloniferum]|uniref:Uncharacterized protein n=2 Tax=Solanum TaxID=4107 RepID=A0AAF0ZYC2_SOLVR|nr:hypothetical protein MTR67_049471 [Solanum verrucosum]